MDQAADVFKLNEDQSLLSSLKAAGLNGQTDRVNEISVKFVEHSEQLQEVRQLFADRFLRPQFFGMSSFSVSFADVLDCVLCIAAVFAPFYQGFHTGFELMAGLKMAAIF